MTPRELLEAFDTLADAPDGVKRLRELVLQLAVRGKLVPQEPDEEPAIALLVKLGSDRREIRVSSPTELYELPASWAWARFDDVAEIASNLVDPRDYPNEPHIAPDNIEKATGRLMPHRTIAEDGVSSSKHKFYPGQILYSKIRPNLSKVVRVDFGGLCSADMYPINPRIDRAYLHLFMLSRPFLDQATADENRLAMPKVNQVQLSAVSVAVAPLSEQRRIVARVDELIGLLDQMEAARTARDEARRAARDAALAALRDAEDASAVESAWARISGRMNAIFNVPEDVLPLRQIILELGVQGRLVPQDPGDDPASLIIEQSAQERRRALGPMRNEPDVPHDGLPPLPVGWSWVPLGALLLNIQAGWSPEAEKRPKAGDEWGVLKVSACSWGQFKPEENKALLPGTEPRLDLEVAPGDFLISRANTVELVGRSVVVGQTPPRLMLSDKTLRLVLTSAAVARYLNLANGSAVARAHYAKNASGTSDSMRNISQESIRRVPIPLPPLAEQHRIMARVDALMALCDALEVKLTAARGLQELFAAAAVHHLDV